MRKKISVGVVWSGVVLSLIIQILKYSILDEKNFNDAYRVIEMMQGNPQFVVQDSYSLTALFFKKIGDVFPLIYSLEKGGIFLWIIAIIPFFFVVRKYMDTSLGACAIAGGYAMLLSLVVISTHKEFLQLMLNYLVAAIAINCSKKKWMIRGIMLFIFLIWGIIFRPYYLLITVICAGLFVWDTICSKLKLVRKKVLILLVIIGFCIVGICFMQKYAPELVSSIILARANVNRERAEMGNVKTILCDVIENSGTFDGNFLLNYFIMGIRMLFPAELFTHGIKYIPYIVIQVGWTFFLCGGIWIIVKRICTKRREIELGYAIIAWYMVAFLFEPDFGSFFRHQIALFPIMYPFMCMEIKQITKKYPMMLQKD